MVGRFGSQGLSEGWRVGNGFEGREEGFNNLKVPFGANMEE